MSRIVVDASVARAAGGLDRKAPSGPCSEALIAVMRHEHSVVVSEPVLTEWKRHASKFSRTWLKSMYAQRRVHHIKNDHWRGIDRVSDAARSLGGSDEDAVLKDLPLVDAAMVTDRRVISDDRAQAQLLRDLVPQVSELGDLAWVPASDGVAAAWLHDGADVVGHRLRDAPKEQQGPARG